VVYDIDLRDIKAVEIIGSRTRMSAIDRIVTLIEDKISQCMEDEKVLSKKYNT